MKKEADTPKLENKQMFSNNLLLFVTFYIMSKSCEPSSFEEIGKNFAQ